MAISGEALCLTEHHRWDHVCISVYATEIELIYVLHPVTDSLLPIIT